MSVKLFGTPEDERESFSDKGPRLRVVRIRACVAPRVMEFGYRDSGTNPARSVPEDC